MELEQKVFESKLFESLSLKDLIQLLKNEQYDELNFHCASPDRKKMEILIFNLPSLKKINCSMNFYDFQGFCQRCPELTEIEFNTIDISSFQWLEYCQNLKRLTIRGGIVKFSMSMWLDFVYGCRNLVYLDISNLGIIGNKDISDFYLSHITMLIRGALKLQELVVPEYIFDQINSSLYPHLKISKNLW